METNTSTSNAPTVAAAADTAGKPRQRRMAREPQDAENAAPGGAVSSNEAKAPSTRRTNSKIAQVIALLEADGGATLDAMVDATGWLPHTTRAALTGLKRKATSSTRPRSMA